MLITVFIVSTEFQVEGFITIVRPDLFLQARPLESNSRSQGTNWNDVSYVDPSTVRLVIVKQQKKSHLTCRTYITSGIVIFCMIISLILGGEAVPIQPWCPISAMTLLLIYYVHRID